MGEKIDKSRATIFVDGGYLRYILHLLFHDDVLDYGMLSQHVGSVFNLSITDVYYYDAKPSKSIDEDFIRPSYHKMISEIPLFSLRLGTIQQTGIKRRQKGVDTHIVSDLDWKAIGDEYDVGILISGDGDFAPPLNNLQERTSKKFYGLYLKRNTSLKLSKQFDKKFVLRRNWLLKRFRKIVIDRFEVSQPSTGIIDLNFEILMCLKNISYSLIILKNKKVHLNQNFSFDPGLIQVSGTLFQKYNINHQTAFNLGVGDYKLMLVMYEQSPLVYRKKLGRKEISCLNFTHILAYKLVDLQVTSP